MGTPSNMQQSTGLESLPNELLLMISDHLVEYEDDRISSHTILTYPTKKSQDHILSLRGASCKLRDLNTQHMAEVIAARPLKLVHSDLSRLLTVLKGDATLAARVQTLGVSPAQPSAHILRVLESPEKGRKPPAELVVQYRRLVEEHRLLTKRNNDVNLLLQVMRLLPGLRTGRQHRMKGFTRQGWEKTRLGKFWDRECWACKAVMAGRTIQVIFCMLDIARPALEMLVLPDSFVMNVKHSLQGDYDIAAPSLRCSVQKLVFWTEPLRAVSNRWAVHNTPVLPNIKALDWGMRLHCRSCYSFFMKNTLQFELKRGALNALRFIHVKLMAGQEADLADLLIELSGKLSLRHVSVDLYDNWDGWDVIVMALWGKIMLDSLLFYGMGAGYLHPTLENTSIPGDDWPAKRIMVIYGNSPFEIRTQKPVGELWDPFWVPLNERWTRVTYPKNILGGT
ncbi:uncharacterized protein K452DRAFT_312840 [Aplosporella prunicola CBS 121167]|uniref:Uncharacterized protein n=1 Tax=Aplosporella prunicola CBS 121167 TaxID=1176127 RepID=A0A6A6AYG8_9PEZI|nr:uncharacterized protein K452DRAFT_312840 [Aplosporella prunicola CBS 121167]KAF2136820.1 hypothetical protein K452DRAFT_312840 [Aplosporella prunicola CBS 121167]